MNYRKTVLGLGLSAAVWACSCSSSSEDGPKVISTEREERLISDLCEQVESQQCKAVSGKDACEAGYIKQLDIALKAECLDKFGEWLSCLVQGPIACHPDLVVYAKQCERLNFEYRLCALSMDGCVGGGTFGSTVSCKIQCGDQTVQCDGSQGQSVSCKCQNSSKQFSAPQCPPSTALIADECASAS